jgi:hypothetical protein
VLSWGMAAAVAVGIAHYFIKGPKTVDEKEV